ncbi:MAG: hypothetical protein QXN15_11310 [Candidatus Jordarchaeales archaeon]
MKKLNIILLKSQEGEWYDLGLRKLLQGIIYAYKVEDETSGKWLFNVQYSEKTGKASVKPISTEKTTWLHDQIKRKTDVFQESKDTQKYYHPLGISYIEKGQLRLFRPSDPNNVPHEIRHKFALTKYEKASPRTPSKALQGKLVVLVEKDKPEEMVHLFVLEKIRPVFPLNA